MNLGIENKLALVTGAGRGIGSAVCESLANEGVRTISVSRSKADLEKLVSKLGNNSKHTYLDADLEKDSEVERVIECLKEKNMLPDIIVNNVGGNLNFTDPLDGIDAWRKVMQLNVEVALRINQAFIPSMIKRKWGRICHISSISALENQGPPAYCAAKAALNAYVRSLGRYVSPDNVILTSVMPGAVLTKDGYWDKASLERPEHVSKYLKERMAIKRFGELNEISNLVAVMCSDLASFCVGTALLVDGGQGRVFYSQE